MGYVAPLEWKILLLFFPKVEKKAAQQMVREERRETKLQKVTHRQLKFAELQDEEETGEQQARRVKKAKAKQSLEDRLAAEAQEGSVMRTETGHTFTFKTEKSR
jgi:hypothetical protein